MPGRRLSDLERGLLGFWTNPPQNFGKPLLRQIRIEDNAALRGIRSLLVPLPYPVTAICGRNGVGKSTILGLAALSAKRPDGFSPYWGNTRPRKTRDAEIEYGFSDFFHRGHDDPSFDGLRVGWVSFDHGNEFEIRQERRNSRWKALPDPGRQGARPPHPVREVDFIPISRILPAGDQAALRNAFGANAAPAITALSQATIAKLSYIMGRQYQAAETRYVKGLGLPACDAGAPYSGFHMGSGEGSIVVILSRLEHMPAGGLLVIEELELGLHAEAQARLIEVLLDYCSRKKIQIVCTTHSEVVLDRLPRIARVLLRKVGNDHEALTNVSTRYCIHEMSGQVQPELIIYTEDTFAADLVGEALIGPLRPRVRIEDIGSNSTLARQAVSHLRSHVAIRAISAFDGDCTDGQVQSWIDSERAERAELQPDYVILPADGLSPERWVVRELANPNFLQRLADALNCTVPEATAHVEAMRVDLDAHDCGFTLGSRIGLDAEEARVMIIRCIARDHPALEAVRHRVAAILNPH